MPIEISGSGTITGVSVGGLPDDIVDAGMMADNSIDSDAYVDASIDNAHLADDAVGVAELSATGTASSSTFLRGDNAWAEAGGGKLLQVINAVQATEVTSSSASYSDTGLTATITPSATTSKVLVICSNDCTKLSADTTVAIRCYRDSTEIGGTIIGRKIADTDDSGKSQSVFSFTILDSPSSTSALVYKTQFCNGAGSGTVRINAGSGSSTICLMEIGA